MLFTIGPVSQFIEPSRKMRDLFAGSHLLSDLSRIVLKQVEGNPKIHVVFPMKELENIPNRVVLKLENDVEARKLGESLEKRMREEWMKLVNEAFKAQNVNLTKSMKQQLDHFLSIHWVVEPFTTYGKTYQSMLKKMHNVKNTRIFHQLYEEPARKCDLYPMYNALIVKEKEDGKLASFVKEEKRISFLDSGFDLKAGEGLSAIAYLKRILDKSNSKFPSVAQMLLKNQLDSTYHSELDALEEDASEVIFSLYNQLPLQGYSEKSIRIGEKLFKRLPKETLRLTPYYALIKLDGDDIGRAYERYSDEEKHTELSKEIVGFSIKAKEIIAKHGGMCIFAGGEDVLAFLPMSTAFSALKEIRTDFQVCLSPYSENNELFTLSAGIIFTHLMSPLQPLLKRVEELESHAKAIDDQKDAFAIELIHRGRKTIPFRSKFGLDSQNIIKLETVIQLLSLNVFSTSLINRIIMVLQRLENANDENLKEIVFVLVQQAMKQAMSMLDKQEQDERIEQIMWLYNGEVSEPVQHLIEQLKIVSFIVKEDPKCSIS